MAASKKKKNKALPLIVMLAVLAVLGIGYKVLSASNDRRAAEEAAEEAAANELEKIAEYDYATMTALSYAKNGEDPLSFHAKNGAWSWDDDAAFPVDQTILTQMANAISTIAIQRRVEEGTEADYGLLEPAYTIQVIYDGGTSHEYKIGDYNTFNSSYYFSADGELCMIAAGLLPYFQYTLDDLLAKDTLPITDWSDETAISAVTVTRDGVSNKITDADGKSEVLAALKKLSFVTCADYDTTDEEKAAFGIDGENSISVTYKKAVTSTDANGSESTSYLDTTYTVDFGNIADEESNLIGGPAKSKLTYVLNGESVASILAYADYVPAPAGESLDA